MESPTPLDERIIEQLIEDPDSFPPDARQALEALIALDPVSLRTAELYRVYYHELRALQAEWATKNPSAAARLEAFTAVLFDGHLFE